VGKMKQYALGACLFTFLFVVIGGGLHLNPGGAFLAALSGTPLMIHIFNLWLESQTARNGARPLVRRQAGRSEEGRHMHRGPTDGGEATVPPAEDSAIR
jgi:hypothetical protein